MTDLGLGLVFIYLFDYYLFSLSLSSLLFSLISSSLFIYYQLSVSHPLSIIHTCCSFDLITHILSLSLPLSLFLSLSINQSINQSIITLMSSSLLTLILSYYSLSSQKNTFSQLIHTGHSHRSSHTEHPIDATFSFPSTQTQQDHTHHTTHSSSNEVFSVSSSSSSMRYDKTRQHNTRKYMTRWLTLSKNDNKNTSGNDKVRIKSPYFLQKSYFIWQNNTKVLIVQYMSNMCSIPKKHLCSLDHQWLVSRWEDEYDHQSSFKG